MHGGSGALLEFAQVTDMIPVVVRHEDVRYVARLAVDLLETFDDRVVRLWHPRVDQRHTVVIQDEHVHTPDANLINAGHDLFDTHRYISFVVLHGMIASASEEVFATLKEPKDAPPKPPSRRGSRGDLQ